MYQNYIFDLYGTLVDIRTDELTSAFWRRAAAIFGARGATYTPGELRALYRKLCRRMIRRELLLHLWTRYIDIDILSVFRQLYLRRDVEPSEELLLETARLFRKASTKHIRLYDGVTELLFLLRDSGKRVFLLSNAQRAFTLPELYELGLYGRFDGIMISSDERICKPDPAFFRRLMRRYAIDPSHSIMIGNDISADILGAKRVGLDTLYIHQDISPASDRERENPADYVVMDGDVRKISPLILRGQGGII